MNITILPGALMLSASDSIVAADKPAGKGHHKRPVYIVAPGIEKKSPEIELIDAVKVHERLSHISHTGYICHT